jgi:hypothetical protein
MSLLVDLVSSLGGTGLGAAGLGFFALCAKLWAWRMRVRDVREHQERLIAAPPEKKAELERTAPPSFPDSVGKVLIAVILGGLTLSACSVAPRVALAVRGEAERCRPACPIGQVCSGSICTAIAKPADLPTAQSGPQKPAQPPAPPVGPQSAADPVLAVRRYSDGSDPFECPVGQ